jgi:beta-1,4-mannooligosaccharide/beta-1,4-mannosyl-N-acetylglucosamine phosphorylase
MIFQRHTNSKGIPSPLLTRGDIPAMAPDIVDPSSVFNPGACSVQGKTLLLLRVQTRGRRSFLVPAVSSDNIQFSVANKPTTFRGLQEALTENGNPLDIFHIYDARLTNLNGIIHVILAADTSAGCRLVVCRATSQDSAYAGLDQLEVLGTTGIQDTRNGVLFPEKIQGRYMILERPNAVVVPGSSSTGGSITAAYSDDLISWEQGPTVMTGRPHFWDELVGAGPPPIKTAAGWLLLYHGVATHFMAANIYQAGAVLLDLENPSQVIARTTGNILEPRELFEMVGQVPNVVFPSGITIRGKTDHGMYSEDSIVHLYYGAADTCVGLATSTIGTLVSACDSV